LSGARYVFFDKSGIGDGVDSQGFRFVFNAVSDNPAAPGQPGNKRQKIAFAGCGALRRFGREGRQVIQPGLTRKSKKPTVSLSPFGHRIAFAPVPDASDDAVAVTIEVNVGVGFADSRKDKIGDRLLFGKIRQAAKSAGPDGDLVAPGDPDT